MTVQYLGTRFNICLIAHGGGTIGLALKTNTGDTATADRAHDRFFRLPD